MGQVVIERQAIPGLEISASKRSLTLGEQFTITASMPSWVDGVTASFSDDDQPGSDKSIGTVRVSGGIATLSNPTKSFAVGVHHLRVSISDTNYLDTAADEPLTIEVVPGLGDADPTLTPTATPDPTTTPASPSAQPDPTSTDPATPHPTPSTAQADPTTSPTGPSTPPAPIVDPADPMGVDPGVADIPYSVDSAVGSFGGKGDLAYTGTPSVAVMLAGALLLLGLGAALVLSARRRRTAAPGRPVPDRGRRSSGPEK